MIFAAVLLNNVYIITAGGIRTVLIQNRDFFITNFEVNNTLKLIFENHIISTEEYRRISSEIDRKKKRQLLYEILVNKDIGIWIKRFQEILKDTGQIYILSNTKDHIEGTVNMYILQKHK